MTRDDLYNQIVDEFMNCGSVKQTAIKVGTSLVRAQRVLITEGLWRSDTSEAVADLLRQGKTTQEIADILHVSIKTVQAYMPYTKGFYSEDKSSDAKRSDSYRKRKYRVANKQINCAERKSEEPMPVNMDSKQDNDFNVMKLRLELILNSEYRNVKQILRKYAKVKEGITREILVPADISLHKLNYAIQRSFGWQNCHLHSFALPEKVFEEMTNGKHKGKADESIFGQNGSFLKWADYCGTYFRFPSGDFEELYWDDDYEGDVSVKTWLKHKYNGYNYYYGNSEHFVCARKRVEDFINENTLLRVDRFVLDHSRRIGAPDQYYKKPIKDCTVSEVDSNLLYGLDELLERLPLNQVLRAKNDRKVRKSQLAKMVMERDQLYEECRHKYVDLASGTMTSQFGLPWSEDDVPVLPITDELIYRYDLGDGWSVNITCEEKYHLKDRFDEHKGCFVKVPADEQTWLDEVHVCDEKDVQIFGEEREIIARVGLLRELRCVYTDGLNVMDDVGGIDGFVEFLVELNEGEPEQREACKAWASNMGWTGRMVKEERVL